MSEKYCINCKHYNQRKRIIDGLLLHLCERDIKKTSKIDLVTGETSNFDTGESLYCHSERKTPSNLKMCGVEGRFFEPKENTDG